MLATSTNEAFQPARHYYAVPDATALKAKLERLACVKLDPTKGCLEWLFSDEAASLRFPGTYEDVPPRMRPIILGRIRFPRRTGMTLQTNSFSRAVEGARFFEKHLGPLAVLLRVRLVNRCFAAGEGDMNELATMLDRDVVVVDPRETELVLERRLQSIQTMEGRIKAFQETQFEDVPLVEDFPIHPEEDAPEFAQLATALNLRAVRAWEHWKGHTDVTLGSLIRKALDPGKKSLARA